MASDGSNKDSYLFDPDILTSINFCNLKSDLPPHITPSSPGDGLVLRPLSVTDFHKGYMDLLSQLTKVGEVSEETYEHQFRGMKESNSAYYIAVIEDIARGKVVASTTLHIERKFIHGAALRGRIEDVVVDKDYRGRQLGKLLVECLLKLGEQLRCYKVTLDCDPKLKPYYEKFGFSHPDVFFLAVRFFD